MATLVVNTWFVRSYTHQHEILGLLKDAPIKITNKKVSDKLFFDVLNYKGYDLIHVSMDAFGLFSFELKTGEEELEDKSRKFMEDVEYLLVEEILKNTQPVSYNQIKEEVMPITFQRIVLAKDFKPEKIPENPAGSLKLYFDDQKIHASDSPLYVSGSDDPELLNALNYFTYTLLGRKFVAKMISIMTVLYRNLEAIDDEINVIESDGAYDKKELEKLKKSIVDTEFIRRDCAERYGRIQQVAKNFEHKEKAYQQERFTGEAEKIDDALKIEMEFEKLHCDADYLMPLWRDVLVENLKNLSSAVGARISFQESLEVKTEHNEIRILRHITVVGLVAALLKLGTLGDFQHEHLALYGVMAIIFSVLIILLIEYFSGHFRKLHI